MIFFILMKFKSYLGVMNGQSKFLTALKILPLLDLLAKFKRVLACSCSPNFCVARKLAKQIFYFCSCSQKNRSARHARECSQRPFVTPILLLFVMKVEGIQNMPLLVISVRSEVSPKMVPSVCQKWYQSAW